MTSHDVIFAHIGKKVLKTADVSKNWGWIGQWNIIFRKELYHSNKMSGEPLLYSKRFRNYGFLSKIGLFCWKMLISAIKSAEISKILTSSSKIWCHPKVLRLLYNRGKFQVSSVKIVDFTKGGPTANGPTYRWSKKPKLCRVKLIFNLFILLFIVLLWNIHTNGQYLNWDSINAFIIILNLLVFIYCDTL